MKESIGLAVATAFFGLLIGVTIGWGVMGYSFEKTIREIKKKCQCQCPLDYKGYFK